jgi:hypothetical protein
MVRSSSLFHMPWFLVALGVMVPCARGDLAGVPTELMAPTDLMQEYKEQLRALGYADEASLVDCDFGVSSGDACNWDLDITNKGLDEDWNLRSGQTPSGDSASGPSSDKSGSGYYVYTESDKNSNQDFGMQLSLGHTFSAYGVSFYYYLRK